MPAEAAPPPVQRPASTYTYAYAHAAGLVKCARCGGSGSALHPLLSPTSTASAPSSGEGAGLGRRPSLSSTGLLVEGVHGLDLHDANAFEMDGEVAGAARGEEERVCGQCARAGAVARHLRLVREVDAEREEAGAAADPLDDDHVGSHATSIDLNSAGLGLQLEGIEERPESRESGHRSLSDVSSPSPDPAPPTHPLSSQPLSIPSAASTHGQATQTAHAHSLPARPTRPWRTAYPSASAPAPLIKPATPPRDPRPDRPYNPLIDVTTERVDSHGRGALYPGSVFRGTQTSGRSAYDVEVRFLDVNIPHSTCSGYLSISHLTDTHPHLTTFFTAELISARPEHGFITGGRWGATEHDDMRHWGRFEQFRRPSTRSDMLRPDLLFRDPLPDRTKGEREGKERDFVFMRIKERFLVPDHRVRDISGASFAGFYYAMLDLAPLSDAPPPTSPSTPRSPLLPVSPSTQYFTLPRRQSQSAAPPAPPAPSATTSAPSPGLPPLAPAPSVSYPTFGGLARDASGLALATAFSPPAAMTMGLGRAPAFARRASTSAHGASSARSASASATGAGAAGPPCDILPAPGMGGATNGQGAAQGQGGGPTSPTTGRRRRESAGRLPAVCDAPREATLRGYYFHSLNQEPFQELFLTHVPSRSTGTFELR